MATELKATVINLKSLNQMIPDPVVGAGDAGGRRLRVIFTQEAAAQFTPNTKVYLSWLHQERNVKGYNVFTDVTKKEGRYCPPTWEIAYPKAMLHEGNVLACIQIVDDVSIATSVNFMIRILVDPNGHQSFTDTDDYSDFQKVVIQINSLTAQMKKQLTAQKLEFEDMQLEFMRIRKIAVDAQENTRLAREYAERALRITESFHHTIEDMRAMVEEADNASINATTIMEHQNDIIESLQSRVESVANNLAETNVQVYDLQQFVNNWDNLIETDIQPLIDAAKREVLDELDNALTIIEF